MRASIVMSTYNGGKYLKEQLDSICVQMTDSDEIIICDDCSSDNTASLIEEYFREHRNIQNVKLVQNEVNLGFQNNFKKAMELSKGEYVFFADQDDIWAENKIEVMLEFMDKTPDCKLLCSDYEPFRSSDNAPIPPKRLLRSMPNNGKTEKISLTSTSIYLKALGCCMCMRREFIDLMNGAWFDRWPHDDRCWKLALCESGLYRMHLQLVRHRLHDRNTSTYKKYHDFDTRISHFSDIISACEIMKQRVDEKTSNKETGKIIQRNIDCLKFRIQWMKTKKPIYLFKLLKYIDCYEAKKSYLVEVALVIKSIFISVRERHE